MSNVYESLNPYKYIIFVTQQASNNPVNKKMVEELRESAQIATVLQMDTIAAKPNGKLPQEGRWLVECLNKSELAASNHVVLVDDVTGGDIVTTAKNNGVQIFGPGTSAEKVLEHFQGHYLI